MNELEYFPTHSYRNGSEGELITKPIYLLTLKIRESLVVRTIERIPGDI